MRAGQAAGLGLRFEVAEPFLTRAAARYRELGDRPATLRAITTLASALLPAVTLDRGVELLESAQHEYADLADTREFVALLGQLARGYMLQERTAEALAWSDRALEAAEHFDLVDLIADALITKGASLSSGSRLYESLTLLDGAERLAGANGLVLTQVRARANQVAGLSTRDPRQAVAIAREGLELARRYGLGNPSVIMGLNGIEAAIRTGEWDWALTELQDLMSMDLDDFRAAGLLAFLITIEACRGADTTEAIGRLRRYLPDDAPPVAVAARHMAEAWHDYAAGDLRAAFRAFMSVADESPLNAPNALVFAARTAVESGELGAAGAALERLDRVGAHGAAIEADREMAMAGIAAGEGRRQEALAGYREALRRYRELGLEFDLALCGLAVATFLPDEPEAREAGEEARRIFERLGTRPFIARLDAAGAVGAPAAPGRRRGAVTRAGAAAEG
jgi:tetratricopeptide (TPR) repeat protein